MITKKLWDSLSLATKKAILETTEGSNYMVTHKTLLYEYHHNFDFDSTGRKLKKVLECCNLQKDGTINVVVNLRDDKFDRVKFMAAPVAPKKNNNLLPVSSGPEREWYVRYDDGDDVSTVWVMATSKEDAIEKAKHDHWDIKEVISCYPA